jgi:alkylated DNA nucleotide flippase Atl1
MRVTRTVLLNPEQKEELEQIARRKPKPEVPWWRVLRAKGKLNDPFPGGAAEQGRRLRLEGIDLHSSSILQRTGQESFVADQATEHFVPMVNLSRCGS